MTGSRWTNDPLHNIMQLSPELANIILNELVEYEIGLWLDVPTGEFTYKPQLVGLDTPFSKQYTPLFLEAVSGLVGFSVWCEGCTEHFDLMSNEHSFMLSMFENCIFYGPITSVDGEYWEWKVHGPGGCTVQTAQGAWKPKECTCHDRGEISFDPGPRFNPRSDGSRHPGSYRCGVRYEWRHTPSSEITARDLDKPGMRHHFMYFNDGWESQIDRPALLDRSVVKICPCCDDERGPREQPVFVNRFRRFNRNG